MNGDLRHRQPLRRAGVTLIEMLIAVAIISVVIIGATRLLTRGLKTSSKGAAHLGLVGAMGSLMAQIEDDCKRATRIVNPPAGVAEPNTQLEILEEDDTGNPVAVSITYDQTTTGLGIRRTHSKITGGTVGPMAEHTYCRGIKVVASFTQMVFASDRCGMLISLHASTANDAERFSVQRFVFGQNLASNTPIPGWRP